MMGISHSCRAFLHKNGQVMIRVRWNNRKCEVGFFKKDVSGEVCVVLVTVGIFSTTAFASVGYYILKHK